MRVTNTTSAASNFIRVTQGDANGIGPEVFLKAFSLLPLPQQQYFILYANQQTLRQTLKQSFLPYEIQGDILSYGSSVVKCHWIDGDAFEALTFAYQEMTSTDILFTLPASKASFPKGCPGHTAYLRQKSGRELGMFFHGNNCKILLLSDHVALDQVRIKLSSAGIFDLLTLALNSSLQHFGLLPKKVYFAGINPHAGENGILGDDLNIIPPAIDRLAQQFKSIQFYGPFSGDTLFQKADNDTWLIYAYHDQGLAPFKATRGHIGANITLGLDFLRLSVDHGTAPDLVGRNQANYLGCLYCLQLAYKTLAKI